MPPGAVYAREADEVGDDPFCKLARLAINRRTGLVRLFRAYGILQWIVARGIYCQKLSRNCAGRTLPDCAARSSSTVPRRCSN